jgi:hypothetical protein
MTRSANADWKEIERLVRARKLTYEQIAASTGVSRDAIVERSRKHGWRRSGARAPARQSLAARRRLLRRFYNAITTKLEQMEHRMEHDTLRGKGASTSADHERDARTIGGLITQLGKLSEYESDLENPAGRGDTAAAVAFAEETERYRRELVERLARLFPPQQ